MPVLSFSPPHRVELKIITSNRGSSYRNVRSLKPNLLKFKDEITKLKEELSVWDKLTDCHEDWSFNCSQHVLPWRGWGVKQKQSGEMKLIQWKLVPKWNEDLLFLIYSLSYSETILLSLSVCTPLWLPQWHSAHHHHSAIILRFLLCVLLRFIKHFLETKKKTVI